MTDIPISAKVECSDGPLGKTTNVIVNPVTRKVPHIVVKDKGLPDNDTRLLPFSKISDATREQITLDCSKSEVAGMPPFIEAVGSKNSNLLIHCRLRFARCSAETLFSGHLTLESELQFGNNDTREEADGVGSNPGLHHWDGRPRASPAQRVSCD